MGLLIVEGEMLSDPGLVEEINEDAVAFIIPADIGGRGTPELLAVLADGMGGQAAGEVASRMAVEKIIRLLPDLLLPVLQSPNALPRVPDALARSLSEANTEIRAKREADAVCAGMGATCTILVVKDNGLFLGHVGDSRAYLCRSGALRQLSEDHSAVHELVRGGQMTEEEARNSPHRNIILRALGLKPDLEPLIWGDGLPLRDGDILVLCSDGLTDVVTDDAIAATITRLPPRDACRSLIDAAIQAGGHDNISVGVFAIRERQADGQAADATASVTPMKLAE